MRNQGVELCTHDFLMRECIMWSHKLHGFDAASEKVYRALCAFIAERENLNLRKINRVMALPFGNLNSINAWCDASLCHQHGLNLLWIYTNKGEICMLSTDNNRT
jgi:hypothetical protein